MDRLMEVAMKEKWGASDKGGKMCILSTSKDMKIHGIFWEASFSCAWKWRFENGKGEKI